MAQNGVCVKAQGSNEFIALPTKLTASVVSPLTLQFRSHCLNNEAQNGVCVKAQGPNEFINGLRVIVYNFTLTAAFHLGLHFLL